MVSLIRGSTFRARQSYVASPSYLRGVRYSSRWFRWLPFDPLSKAIAKIDRDTVHEQGHDHQDQARGRGVQMKFLLRARNPIEHLNRHDRERRHKPVKRDKGKFTLDRW